MADNQVNLNGIPQSNNVAAANVNVVKTAPEEAKQPIEFKKDEVNSQKADGLEVAEGAQGTPEERAARAEANKKAVEEMSAMKNMAAQTNKDAKNKISPELTDTIMRIEDKYIRMGEMNAIIRMSKDPDLVKYAENTKNQIQQEIDKEHSTFWSDLSDEQQKMIEKAEEKYYQMGEIKSVIQYSDDPKMVNYAQKSHSELQVEILNLHRQIF